jgi:phage shock protein A
VEVLSGPDTTTGTLDAFAQMEVKVDEVEAEADASADLRADQRDGVDQRLNTLEKDAEVAARLAALRAQIGAH